MNVNNQSTIFKSTSCSRYGELYFVQGRRFPATWPLAPRLSPRCGGIVLVKCAETPAGCHQSWADAFRWPSNSLEQSGAQTAALGLYRSRVQQRERTRKSGSIQWTMRACIKPLSQPLKTAQKWGPGRACRLPVRFLRRFTPTLIGGNKYIVSPTHPLRNSRHAPLLLQTVDCPWLVCRCALYIYVYIWSSGVAPLWPFCLFYRRIFRGLGETQWVKHVPIFHYIISTSQL